MPRGHFKGYRWTTPEARFWKYVRKAEDVDGCWEWTGYTQPVTNHPELRGYGQMRVDDRTVLTHVFSWERHIGPVPDGLCVLHRCDNRPCVRPDHLFLGTKKDNIQDALGKDRIPWGDRASWSKLTMEQVLEIRERARRGGESYCALARAYGVNDTTIRHIVHRKNWKQVP